VPDAPKTGSGAAFRKGDASFMEAYNKELEAFKDTADFDAMMKKWGFDAAAAKSTTSAELCKNEG
jgi:polar amino acid transport system substrate-binding protein